MNEAQQGLKDRNLQDYYESMQSMFVTKGWKYHAEDLTRLLEAANSLAGIESLEAFYFRKGQVDMLMKMLAQPQVIEKAYEILLTEDNA